MTTKLKIIGEHTRPTNEAMLCLSCSYSMVVRGTRFGDDFVRCNNGVGRVRFHVTECSGYSDAGLIPLYRLEETAWRMFSGRFVSPSDFIDLQRQAVQGGGARLADDDA